MQLSPTVPRRRLFVASQASSRMERLMPKLALAFSVPARDWKVRSTGTPRLISSMVLVTCVSTQLWVGIWYLEMRPSSI